MLRYELKLKCPLQISNRRASSWPDVVRFNSRQEDFDGLGIIVLLSCGSSPWLLCYGNLIARIRGIERKLNALLRHNGVDPTLGLPLSDRVKQIAADPVLKIEAIKIYREETGASLAEAKEAVEMFLNSA